MKKMITLVLAVSILFTVPVFAAGSAASFSDIPSDYWAYGAVMEMTKQGLFEGTTTPVNGVGTFSPEVTMSCADFVTVVDRALYSTEFSAMAASDPWWKNSYDLAVSKGILKAGELDMSKPMSRQEMALVLSRATSDNPTQVLSTSRIPDYSSIGAAYKDAVIKVYSLGMLTGVDNNGTFAPTATMTRAQGATVLNRLTNKSARVTVDFTAVAPTKSEAVTLGTPTKDPDNVLEGVYAINTKGYKYLRLTNSNNDDIYVRTAAATYSGKLIDAVTGTGVVDVSGYNTVYASSYTGSITAVLENAASIPSYSIPAGATALTDQNTTFNTEDTSYSNGQFIRKNHSPMSHCPARIYFSNTGYSTLTFTVTTLDEEMVVQGGGVASDTSSWYTHQVANATKTYTIDITGATIVCMSTFHSDDCDSIITNAYVK